MKRIILLAALALILPNLATAADSTSDWRVWGQKVRNTRNGEVVLVIAGIPVAASRLGSDTTLRGRYENLLSGEARFTTSPHVPVRPESYNFV